MREELFAQVSPNSPSTENSLRSLLGYLRKLRPTLVTNPQLREQLATDYIAYLTKRFPYLDSRGESSIGQDNLELEGLHSLGVLLGPTEIESVHRQLAGLQFVFEGQDLSILGTGRLSDRRTQFPDATIAHLPASSIASIPELFGIFQNLSFVRTLSFYFGGYPIVSSVNLWASFSRSSASMVSVAERFHRDKDCFRFVKLFVYLTDVDHESGPHEYVKGSHKLSRFSKILSAKPDSLLPLFHGSQRNNGKFWEHAISSGLVGVERIIGEPGFGFLEDTYGLHRGVPPRSQDRILFQVLFTLLPWECVMYDDLAVLPFPRSVLDHTDPTIQYMFQMFGNSAARF